MNSGAQKAEKFDELMRLVEQYEVSPRAVRLERLLELHRDLMSDYPTLRRDEAACGEMDQALLKYFDTRSQSSDLRQALLHLHATRFAYVAGGHSGHAEAHHAATALYPAGLPNEQPFFREILVARLLDGSGRPLDNEVRFRLLQDFARFENENAIEPIFVDARGARRATPRLLVLGLIRRAVNESGLNLALQPGSLENQLKNEHFFDDVVAWGPIFRDVMQRLAYASRPPWWVRLRRAVRAAWDPLSARSRFAARMLVGFLLLGLTLGILVATWRANAALYDEMRQAVGESPGGQTGGR